MRMNPLHRQAEPQVGPGIVNTESEYRAHGAVNGASYFTQEGAGRIARGNIANLDGEIPGWEVISQLDTAEKNFTDAENNEIAAAQQLVDEKLEALAEHSLERNLKLVTLGAARKKFGNELEEELAQARQTLQQKLKDAYVAHGVDERLFSLEASDDEDSEKARGVMNSLRLLSAADEVDKMTDAMEGHAHTKFDNTPPATPTTPDSGVKKFAKKGWEKLKKVGSKAVDAYSWASERKDDGKRRWGRTLVKGAAVAGIGVAAGVALGVAGAGAAAAGLGVLTKKVVNAGFMGAVKKRNLRENINQRIADINREAKEALHAVFHSEETTDSAAGIAAARNEVNSITRKNRVEMGAVVGTAAIAGAVAAEAVDIGDIAHTATAPFRWVGSKVEMPFVDLDNPFSQDAPEVGNVALDKSGTEVDLSDVDASDMDVDGDGTVDSEELNDALESGSEQVTVLGEKPSVLDSDDNGNVTVDELKQASPEEFADAEVEGAVEDGAVGEFVSTSENAVSLSIPTFEEMSHFTSYEYPSNWASMDELRRLTELASKDFDVKWHNLGDGNDRNDWIEINGHSETPYVLAILSRYAEQEALAA